MNQFYTILHDFFMCDVIYELPFDFIKFYSCLGLEKDSFSALNGAQ